MLYTNMPVFGERPAVLYEQAFYPGGQQTATGLPTDLGMQYAVQTAKAQYYHPALPATDELLIVDVERWHVWPWVQGSAHRTSVEKYANVARRIKAASNQPVCVYSIAPSAGILHANWSVTDPAVRAAWTTHSDVTAEVLVPEVDALCPALYTYYGGETAFQLDQAITQWEVYARETIAEARRMAPGKPVYAFAWPQYHSGGMYKDYRLLEDRYWRAQLELLRELADGVILWGGWNFDTNRQANFDPNASWYRIYREIFPE